MVSWAEFRSAAAELEDAGRRLLDRSRGAALLTTVRGDGLPRIHPISVAIIEGSLVAFILDSPKATDLSEDGRYALHAHHDPAEPHEFVLRGRATLIDDTPTRRRIGDAWFFGVGDDDRLFEFGIEHAILGERATADDWPPRYRSWRSGD
jgi:hypothetical protein